VLAGRGVVTITSMNLLTIMKVETSSPARDKGKTIKAPQVVIITIKCFRTMMKVGSFMVERDKL
jgi:hypothetical protein